MDPTLEALWQAILIDRKDEAARLAYTDRLEEVGQGEKAEWIRKSIANNSQLYCINHGKQGRFIHCPPLCQRAWIHRGFITQIDLSYFSFLQFLEEKLPIPGPLTRILITDRGAYWVRASLLIRKEENEAIKRVGEDHKEQEEGLTWLSLACLQLLWENHGLTYNR